MRDKSPETLRIQRHKQRDKRALHDARIVEHNKLTAQEQLMRLDNRLGVGIGAVKERKRLYKILNKTLGA
ncbi:hypothetical protein LCGC14_1582410 [marine sediment metagenome]|uniref:Uncharacterized protein n=1 Tax=marine sediment metagenome TaxID=412755 RepID=A0A0F9IGQ2_9ZZZZ